MYFTHLLSDILITYVKGDNEKHQHFENAHYSAFRITVTKCANQPCRINTFPRQSLKRFTFRVKLSDSIFFFLR